MSNDAVIITVRRVASDEDATLSTVSVNGSFVCFGLEDEYRRDKVVGETRIPAGHYRVGLRKVGGFHKRYERAFGDMHHGMLEVCDVPGFRYILIHIGNSDDDTSGCLLVGTGAVAERGALSVTHSRRAYLYLYSLVIEAAMADKLSIMYVDDDGAAGSA